MHRLLFALALATLTAPAPAHADDEPPSVLVLPPAGSVPGDPDAGSRLGQALVGAATEGGARAELAQVSRADVFTLAGCDEETPACYRRVRSTLDVDAIVVSTIEPSEDGGATVSVTLVEEGEAPVTRTYQLESTDAAVMSRELAAGEDPIFGSGGDEGPAEPGGALRFEASRVESYRWGIAAGGAAALLTGGVLLLAADSKQEDVNRAPTNTVADLERLEDLEDSGKAFTLWGNVFAIVGLAATATGAVLVLRQGLVRTEEAPPPAGGEPVPEVSVSPMPLRGGGGVSLTVRGLP